MSVTAPLGFRAAGVAAGLKESGQPDVAVVLNDGPSRAAAAVFTRNRVQAAPVTWTRQVVSGGRVRAVVLNSGGANACTGAPGFQDTHATAERLAAAIGDSAGEIAVCSTGLIGERLPMDKLLPGVDAAVAAASRAGGLFAADAIRTTDTVVKIAFRHGAATTVPSTSPTVPPASPIVPPASPIVPPASPIVPPAPSTAPDKSDISDMSGSSAGVYAVGGMAKGAGMLAPALATMLCVLTTDADLPAADLDVALRSAVAESFDRLDTDGCMSTNDTVLLLASGATGVRPDIGEFTVTLTEVCADLARQLQWDAEGAQKMITIEVIGAVSETDALTVGRAIARSNLVKCAIGGEDPNWGRILAAVGTTDAVFEPGRLNVAVNGVWVCRHGAAGDERAKVDLARKDVTITVDLSAGSQSAVILTTDLTAAYVHENSAYST
jgi:glutamate N-acetyltransferase / amino-acid N-acetyltransferase